MVRAAAAVGWLVLGMLGGGEAVVRSEAPLKCIYGMTRYRGYGDGEVEISGDKWLPAGLVEAATGRTTKTVLEATVPGGDSVDDKEVTCKPEQNCCVLEHLYLKYQKYHEELTRKYCDYCPACPEDDQEPFEFMKEEEKYSFVSDKDAVVGGDQAAKVCKKLSPEQKDGLNARGMTPTDLCHVTLDRKVVQRHACKFDKCNEKVEEVRKRNADAKKQTELKCFTSAQHRQESTIDSCLCHPSFVQMDGTTRRDNFLCFVSRHADESGFGCVELDNTKVLERQQGCLSEAKRDLSPNLSKAVRGYLGTEGTQGQQGHSAASVCFCKGDGCNQDEACAKSTWDPRVDPRNLPPRHCPIRATEGDRSRKTKDPLDPLAPDYLGGLYVDTADDYRPVAGLYHDTLYADRDNWPPGYVDEE